MDTIKLPIEYNVNGFNKLVDGTDDYFKQLLSIAARLEPGVQCRRVRELHDQAGIRAERAVERADLAAGDDAAAGRDHGGPGGGRIFLHARGVLDLGESDEIGGHSILLLLNVGWKRVGAGLRRRA